RDLLKSRPQQVERTVASKLTESDVVYTDYRSASSLVFFRTGLLLPSTSTTIPYEDVGLLDMKRGSYVLIDTNMTNFMTSGYKYQRPAFVESPPETWKKVWADMNAVLYQITESSPSDP